MKKITSVSNETIKFFNSLKEKKNIIKEKLFLIEGKHIIQEAHKKQKLVGLISIDEEYLLKFASKLNKYLVTQEIIDKLSTNITNDGTIGICEVSTKKVELSQFNKILVLDSINNPGNLGTIIRSAVAFNFDAIVTVNESTFLYNDKVIKGAQGLIFDVPVINLGKTNYTELGRFNKYAFVLQTGSKSFDKVEYQKPYALVFGNEANGISLDFLDKNNCDLVRIDMNGKVESLNVGTAASIAMYEARKHEK